VPNTRTAIVKGLAQTVPYFPERNYTISGVTIDATGAALGNCVVRLFNTATNTQEQVTTSDASGAYAFVVDKTQAWYVVSYKAGAPDVTGITVNTIAGT
jgi:hypothetical protein